MLCALIWNLCILCISRDSIIKASAVGENITARADYLYNLEWTAKKTIEGWNGTFWEGNTYHLPYGQPYDTSGYIYWDISIDDFINSTKNEQSDFYSKQSKSNPPHKSPCFALDCSAFASYCWDLPRRTTTHNWASLDVEDLGICNTDNIPKIQPGDALNNANSHVAIVTRINNDGTFEITEQTTPQMLRRNLSAWSLASQFGGYRIYRYNKRDAVSAPPQIYGVNEGNDFYATIAKCDTWSIIGTNNGNVEVVESTGKANCIWHFVRSADGSYVIYNCEDNRVLDCYEDYEGASVGVWDFYDSVTQHWWIKGKQNGEYSFVRNGTELVLDVTGGSADIGTNVELYHYHGGGAQLFSIYKVDKAEAGNLYVDSGNSNTETKFSWDKGTNCNLYNLRIRKGSPGNTTPYLDKWNLTDTSYSEVLPAGYYEAYVDFCNSFSASGGQVIQFYVSDPVAGISTISVTASNSKTSTKFYWTETENTTVYNLRILSEQDGEMKSYQDVWNLTDTSYELVLPVGKYEVYVNACNDYNYSTSNKVQFLISEPIAGVSTISVAASNSKTPTKFYWTETENTTVYNLRILSEQNGEMKSYQDVWNLTDTSYELVLPVGKYEVYVDACNDENYSTSNRVQFSVSEPIAGISKIFVTQGDKLNPTKFTWTEAENITVYNLRILSEQDGEMKSYQDIWNLTDTSYQMILPEGIYEVYVNACNDFNYSTSEVIRFEIVESIIPSRPLLEFIMNETATYPIGLKWNPCSYADSYSINIYKQDGESSELIKSIDGMSETQYIFNLDDGFYYATVTSVNSISNNSITSGIIDFEIHLHDEQIEYDYNMDETFSIADVVLLSRFISEDETLAPVQINGIINADSDIDKDGMSTILDVISLLKMLITK